MVVKLVVKKGRRDLRGCHSPDSDTGAAERGHVIEVMARGEPDHRLVAVTRSDRPSTRTLTQGFDMTIIMVMSTQSLAAVKAHFSQVIDEVAGTHERVVVTKNGSPVAVILAVEDYESLMETLEILSDPRAVAEIRQAEAQMQAGEQFGEADVRAALAARRG
jgi:prevent-host-death family protein